MSSLPTGVLRVGMIGAGLMGADDVNTLHRYVSGVTVTAVVDIDAERRARRRAAAGGDTTEC